MDDEGVSFAARAIGALDGLPLECDGVSRCLSQLLLREGVAHEIHVGALEVVGVGRIDHHWWVELPGGQVCDVRAAMWLGNDPRVPHGVFGPQPGQQYVSRSLMQSEFSPVLFWIIAEQSIDEFVLPPEPSMLAMRSTSYR